MSRRDEVLRAAVELLDEVGLDALTIRRLAARLGVQPGALYRHFDTKHALLTSMVDHIVRDLGVPPVDGEWPDRLRARATAYRTALLTHRDGARLVATHLRPGRATQHAWDQTLDIMRNAGLDLVAAERAVDTVFAYVNGFSIEEQSRDGFPPPASRRAWRDKGFDAGLELIITGVRHELSHTGSAVQYR